jgi:hypothetical protein
MFCYGCDLEQFFLKYEHFNKDDVSFNGWVGPIVQNYITQLKTTFGYRGKLGQFLNIYKNTWKGNVWLWGDRFVT